jgi:hypothetical protein
VIISTGFHYKQRLFIFSDNTFGVLRGTPTHLEHFGTVNATDNVILNEPIIFPFNIVLAPGQNKKNCRNKRYIHYPSQKYVHALGYMPVKNHGKTLKEYLTHFIEKCNKVEYKNQNNYLSSL